MAKHSSRTQKSKAAVAQRQQAAGRRSIGIRDVNGVKSSRWVSGNPQATGRAANRAAADRDAADHGHEVIDPFSPTPHRSPTALDTAETRFNAVRTAVAGVLLELVCKIDPSITDAKINDDDLDELVDDAIDFGYEMDNLGITSESDYGDRGNLDYNEVHALRGIDFALARFGDSENAYWLFADDPEVRTRLTSEARDYGREPSDLYVDRWGEIRLFRVDETTTQAPDWVYTGEVRPVSLGEPGFERVRQDKAKRAFASTGARR